LEQQKVTYQQVCEQIAKWLNKGIKNRRKLTGEDIFTLSPTGDLFHVHELHNYMVNKCHPGAVLISIPYLSELVMRKLNVLY
jgi:hypothetical protein